MIPLRSLSFLHFLSPCKWCKREPHGARVPPSHVIYADTPTLPIGLDLCTTQKIGEGNMPTV